MCDYSAEHAVTRQAATGDRLVVGKISDHTIGMTSVNDPDTAVCLIPGTKLTFSRLPEDFATWHLLNGTIHGATFAQREARDGYFTDGIIFDDEKEFTILQCVPEGAHAMVEMIPGKKTASARLLPLDYVPPAEQVELPLENA